MRNNILAENKEENNMPQQTYPNQRMVKVHREKATSDFLGIKNENWQAASRDLGAHALRLYLYLAANADNYTLALSPAAIRHDIGMPRSTYHDQFHILEDKGYIKHLHGNTYEFFETPQSRNSKQEENQKFSDGHAFTADDNPIPSNEPPISYDDNFVLSDNIEINNNDIKNTAINNLINSENPVAEELYPVGEYTSEKPISCIIPKGDFTF